MLKLAPETVSQQEEFKGLTMRERCSFYTLYSSRTHKTDYHVHYKTWFFEKVHK